MLSQLYHYPLVEFIVIYKRVYISLKSEVTKSISTVYTGIVMWGNRNDKIMHKVAAVEHVQGTTGTVNYNWGIPFVYSGACNLRPLKALHIKTSFSF